jgi:hypothetical protein
MAAVFGWAGCGLREVGGDDGSVVSVYQPALTDGESLNSSAAVVASSTWRS